MITHHWDIGNYYYFLSLGRKICFVSVCTCWLFLSHNISRVDKLFKKSSFLPHFSAFESFGTVHGSYLCSKNKYQTRRFHSWTGYRKIHWMDGYVLCMYFIMKNLIGRRDQIYLGFIHSMPLTTPSLLTFF